MTTQPKTVRLPPDIAERLRLVAFQRRVSQTSIIVEAVRAEVQRLERLEEDAPSNGGEVSAEKLKAVVSEGDFPIDFYNDPPLGTKAWDVLRTMCAEEAAGRDMVLSTSAPESRSVVYKRLVDGPEWAPVGEECAADLADHVTLRLQCWAVPATNTGAETTAAR